MTLASKPAVYTGYNSTLGKRVRPGYTQAARVRALGPSRANPWAPRRRRVTVSLENEGDSGLGCSDHHDGGGGRGPSRTHRFYVSLSYAALRTALGIENGPLVGGLISNILFFMYGSNIVTPSGYEDIRLNLADFRQNFA